MDEIIDTLKAPTPQPLRYVTFTEDGTLDGCYLQVPPEDHVGRMLVIDEEQARAWTNYRATATRDGLELAPPPAPAAPQVPQQCTMRQARLALLAAGKLDGVDAAIESLPSPQKEAARIEWNYARDVLRESPMVSLMGAALGLDDAQKDDLFILAVTL